MGVEQQFHFPATSEERDGLPFNRNQSPCARISSGSACAKLRGFKFPAHRNLRVSEGVENLFEVNGSRGIFEVSR